MKKIDQAGGIVLNQSGKILIVKALTGAWTFPKGKLEENESLEDAAKREITEETSVTGLVLIKKLGAYERLGYTKKNLEVPSVIKHITFFLFHTSQEEIAADDPGILAVKWADLTEVASSLTYDEDRKFFIEHKASVNAVS